jgi:hypothetical protein
MSELTETLGEAIASNNLEQVHYNLSQAKKFFGHNVSSCLDFELK